MNAGPFVARYPFFSAAREAVRESGVSLADLVARDAPAVERGRERVERGLTDGTTAPEDPTQWDDSDELLSYPVARIVVSLIDDATAVEKYAAAEAATAADRFREDFAAEEPLRSVEEGRVSREQVLEEFELDAIPESGGRNRGSDSYRVDVGTYLTLVDSGWGDRWRLVNRELLDGRVRVDRDDLDGLLEEAVRRRVADGLPFEVRERNPEMVESLEPTVADVRSLLSAGHAPRTTPDVVDPGSFPPCIRALVERSRSDELNSTSRFALTSFLVALGADAEEVTTLTGLDAETVNAQVAFLRDGDGTQYPPPSCATMVTYGDCVNTDERCERITHPLSYYDDAVSAGSGTDAVTATDGDAADE